MGSIDVVSSLRRTVAIRGKEAAGFALAAALCLAALAAPLPVLAGEPPAPVPPEGGSVPAASELPPADPLGRETPRGSIVGYLDACRENDWSRAARFLDLSSFPEAVRAGRGPELAQNLKVILDRQLWIEVGQMSDRPEGKLDDRYGEHMDRIEPHGVQTRRGEVDLLLERVEQEGRLVWLVASSSVERIPTLYAEFGYGPLGEVLPQTFFEVRFLEVQLWQWIGLLLLIFVAYLLSWIAASVVYRLVKPFVLRTRTSADDRLLDVTLAPLRLSFAVTFFAAGLFLLRLSVPAQAFAAGLLKGMSVLILAWLLLRVVDVVAGLVEARLLEEGRKAVVSVVPLGRRAVKVVILGLAVIAMLQNLGFNVTGVLAGLGVGGLAVALAAQKSLENLFGGVSVIADQPVRVGDFCRFGDKMGTVEDVGLRSTRIRTLDRTVISVPNAEFSSLQIENFAKRDRMRLSTMLGLRYETSPDQLRHVLAGLRRLLLAHPRVTDDPARVRFVGFGAYSLDLEVFAYVDTSDWNEFLSIREDLYLRMMDVVEASGTGFAFPSQTLYMGRDDGLDRERAKEAEGEVESWRGARRLPFPAFTPEMVAEVQNSLPWPPEGSPPLPVPSPEADGEGRPPGA